MLIIWNKKLPIDRDIRKTMGTIIQATHVQNHLAHDLSQDQNGSSFYHEIHWTTSRNWFQHNTSPIGTSAVATKDLAWMIKVSTNTLHTLTILDRNFPRLIKGRTTCLLCHSEEETNLHFWNCPVLLPTIKETFKILADYLINLLTTHGDKLTLICSDTVKYSSTYG